MLNKEEITMGVIKPKQAKWITVITLILLSAKHFYFLNTYTAWMTGGVCIVLAVLGLISAYWVGTSFTR